MSEDPLQSLARAQAGRLNIQQPVDAVTAENLPPQTPWKWEEVCKLVGSLYLESHHRYNSLDTHAKSILSQLDEQRKLLVKEVGALRVELDKREKMIEALNERNGEGG